MSIPIEIPTGSPLQRFMRYVRPPINTVGQDNAPLFPLRPTSRPLRVGIDTRTFCDPFPGDLLDVLRRDDVEPYLLVQKGDQQPNAWMDALNTHVLHTLNYTSFEAAARSGDATELWFRTTERSQMRRTGRCHFFGVYQQLDRLHATEQGSDDLTPDDRYRAAAFAAAAGALGVDVILTNAPTAGRADVADNDIVISVLPDGLLPIFGHYLRINCNHHIRITTGDLVGGGTITRTGSTRSVTDLYDAGVGSGLMYFECLQIAAKLQGQVEVSQSLASIHTRLGRAVRALDTLLAALTNSTGSDTKAEDATEWAAEAFDRELLYLVAAFDGFGRLYRLLLNQKLKPESIKQGTLHADKFLAAEVINRYPEPLLAEVIRLQKYANVCAQLRHRIHASVLPAGQYLSRPYGSAKTVAVDISDLEALDPTVSGLQQGHYDRLGVWWAESEASFGPPAYVADLATLGVALMETALEYIDAFSKLILCNNPSDAPDPNPVLGSAPEMPHDLTYPASSEELYHRALFGWHTGTSSKSV